MKNISALEYNNMTETERVTWATENEKPYLAVNGHTMQACSQWAGGRPIYSSAWATCTDDCAACQAGESPPDW